MHSTKAPLSSAQAKLTPGSSATNLNDAFAEVVVCSGLAVIVGTGGVVSGGTICHR